MILQLRVKLLHLPPPPNKKKLMKKNTNRTRELLNKSVPIFVEGYKEIK